LAPFFAAAWAASTPAWPAPITMQSKSFVFIMLGVILKRYLIMTSDSFKNSKHETRNTKQIRNSKSKWLKRLLSSGYHSFKYSNFGHLILFRISIFGFRI
jgi:hypothetical protein